MESISENQSHTNNEGDANMNNYSNEEQDDSLINKFDNHSVNNIFDNIQVCIDFFQIQFHDQN